jgi:hypothetical protein
MAKEKQNPPPKIEKAVPTPHKGKIEKSMPTYETPPPPPPKKSPSTGSGDSGGEKK